MKLQSLIKVLTAGVITITTTSAFIQPSNAENKIFSCAVSSGVPTTIANTSKGKITIIRWVSSYFNATGYTPQKRCEEVSARFQRNKDRGTLKYITTGMMDGQPVVCVSKTNGGGCIKEDGLLFTLKSQQDASSTVQQLFNIRKGDGGSLNETPDRIYIDVSQLLNSRQVEEDNTPSTTANTACKNTPNNSKSIVGGNSNKPIINRQNLQAVAAENTKTPANSQQSCEQAW